MNILTHKHRNVKLITELKKLSGYLNQSTDSMYAHKNVFEIKEFIDETINKIDNNKKIEIDAIYYLIVPTGSLQEISIDNGWDEEFITIANRIEKIIVK